MKKTAATLLTLVMAAGLAACGSGGGNNTGTNESGSGASQAASETPTASASASASSDNKPVTLRIAWWGGQSRHDYTLKLIDMYEKEHPNVKIEAEYAAFDDYWKKLAPEAAANQLPDVLQMDISYLNQYAGRNQLADLTPYTQNGRLDVSSVNQNSIAGGQVDGKLYAMNLGNNALTMIVDPAMMQQAGIDIPENGWSWDQLDEVGAKAKAAGKLLYGDLRHDVYFPFYLRSQGQHMYDTDKLGYDDDKYFIDYYTRYKEWYDKGYLLSLDKLSQSKGTPEEDSLTLGNAVASSLWSNQFIGIAEAAKRDLKLLPAPGWDSNQALFLKPSMYFSVANSSKVKDAAVDFINWFINDVEANKIILGERGVPVSSKVQEAIRPLLSENQQKVFDYVAWAESHSSQMDPPNPIGAVEVDALLKAEAEKILYNQISVQDGAAEFRQKANAILAKNK